MGDRWNGFADWAEALEPRHTPTLSMIRKHKLPSRPIIGHEPGKNERLAKALRGVSKRIYRVRYGVEDWLVGNPEDDEGNPVSVGGVVSRVVGAIERPAARLNGIAKRYEGKPIYDPDWVDPTPRKIEWGTAVWGKTDSKP